MDINTIKQAIDSAKSLKELDATYKKYLGRKGEIALALRELGDLSEGERREKGPELQALKRDLEEAYEDKASELKKGEIEKSLGTEKIDITAPGIKMERGHLHPLTQIQNKIYEIFSSLGFEVVEGPEVETEWYNFDALNIPKDHPARDLWDTFWLLPKNQNLLLRTHTSPVQIRYMEKNQPPFRIIAPGRAFRHEASDASHDIQFYQLEGLMVGADVSVANFKAIMGEFLKKMFGEDVKMRLRPSFFPFVEPGFEIDMEFKGEWMEMMGAGMVHPKVLEAAKIDSREWRGFAFGIGIDRIAMLKYKIDDIRLFYGGDLRFIKQF